MKQQQHPNKSFNYFLLDQGRTHIRSFSNNRDTITGIIYSLSPFGGKLLLPKDSLVTGETMNLLISQAYGLNELLIKCKILWKKNQPESQYDEIACQFINSSNQLTLDLMELIRITNMSNKKMNFHCELKLKASLNT